MLRFRNRFTGTQSQLHQCPCGRRVTESSQGGRQTLIHELPWCPVFTRVVEQLRADPSSQLHQAVVLIEAGKDTIETIVTADGDTTDDINAPVPVSPGGSC
jgi:hypothetical protein